MDRRPSSRDRPELGQVADRTENGLNAVVDRKTVRRMKNQTYLVKRRRTRRLAIATFISRHTHRLYRYPTRPKGSKYSTPHYRRIGHETIRVEPSLLISTCGIVFKFISVFFNIINVDKEF